MTGPSADWKEGNVLFNDALDTFYLRLCGIGRMIKDPSDSDRGNPFLWAVLYALSYR